MELPVVPSPRPGVPPHADTGFQVIVEMFSFSDCTLQDFYFFVDVFRYFLFVVQPEVVYQWSFVCRRQISDIGGKSLSLLNFEDFLFAELITGPSVTPVRLIIPRIIAGIGFFVL